MKKPIPFDELTPEQEALVSGTEAAPSATLDLAGEIEETLLDAGLPATTNVIEALEDVCESAAIRLAADFIRSWAWALKGARGVAIRRQILGDSGETLRDCEELDGVPKSSLARHETAVRKKVGQRKPIGRSV